MVADLRLSIFDLRSDVSATNGLGSALSDYVRQVGAKSDLTVHLTLNEAATRLSPAVEGELLRIAQEAITNARKHASARQPVGGLLDEPAAGQPHRARRRPRASTAGATTPTASRSCANGPSRIDATLEVTSESDRTMSHAERSCRLRLPRQELLTHRRSLKP